MFQTAIVVVAVSGTILGSTTTLCAGSSNVAVDTPPAIRTGTEDAGDDAVAMEGREYGVFAASASVIRATTIARPPSTWT